MADIFVSYASQDRAHIEPLVRHLEGDGYSVWWDRELKGGTVFSQRIEEEVRAAKVVLVAWSPASLTSRWVADEADLAMQTGKLVPITFDDVQSPMGFRQLQAIDFSNWRDGPDDPCVAALLDALLHHLTDEDQDEGHSGQSRDINTPRGMADASIAVLPFVNMSSDPEQEYFSDGISEELLNLLAKIKELRVTARTSSFGLKGTTKQVEEIGKLLGVAHVLEGSVRKAGNRIRITAQLIDTTNGFHMWSETYDRTLDDIFAIQDEISAAIVESLKDQLLGVDDIVVPQSHRSSNVEAYDRYLRGHYLIQATAIQSIERGLEDLRAATKLDPEFSLPYADISDAIAQLVSYGIYEAQDLLGEARDAAYSAVSLAPDLAQAHSALALVHQFITMDWPAADAAFETAISLSAESPIPYHRYADFLTWTLRIDKARQMAKRAREIDPGDSNSMHADGLTALFAGDFSAAAEAFGIWNRSFPDNRWSYVKHAVALALDGQCDASLKQALAAAKLGGPPPTLPMEMWLGWTHAICGRQDLYEKSKSIVLSTQAEDAFDQDVTYFYLHCIEGDCEALVKIIQRMVDTQSPLTQVVQLPVLDYMGWPVTTELKNNETYQELLKSLNFPKTQWSLD